MNTFLGRTAWEHVNALLLLVLCPYPDFGGGIKFTTTGSRCPSIMAFHRCPSKLGISFSKWLRFSFWGRMTNQIEAEVWTLLFPPPLGWSSFLTPPFSTTLTSFIKVSIKGRNEAAGRSCGGACSSQLRLPVCHWPAVACSGHGCIELWGLLPRTGLISPLAVALSFVVMEMSDFKAGRMRQWSHASFQSDPISSFLDCPLEPNNRPLHFGHGHTPIVPVGTINYISIRYPRMCPWSILTRT